LGNGELKKTFSLLKLTLLLMSTLTLAFNIQLVKTEPPSAHAFLQRVVNDRIIDGETEVMWRGAGGSYLFHAGDQYQQAWINHLPSIQKMGLNTMRLAFKFPWDTLTDATADDLDYAKMDWVVSWLASHGVKSILDYHGSKAQMYGSNGVSSDTINPLLVQSWQEMAAHFKGNSDVVAYEVYNEPAQAWGTTYRRTARQNAEGYNALTLAIRQIDPGHICIWETPEYYIPPFNEIADLMLPNIVYTAHRWWTNSPWLPLWGAEKMAYYTIETLVKWRSDYKIPIWLGEFGLGGGGNDVWDPTNLHNLVCQRMLDLSEKQVIPWNLWQGAMSINKRWYVEDMFPLQFINTNLVRQPCADTKTSFSLSPNPAKAGETITLTGNLADKYDNPIGSAPVRVYYSINDGIAWVYAGTLQTNSTGGFKATGKLTIVGFLLIAVVYKGNFMYNPSYHIETLTITLPE
jgi:hypothetical protein